jgi:hypothetical protein
VLSTKSFSQAAEACPTYMLTRSVRAKWCVAAALLAAAWVASGILRGETAGDAAQGGNNAAAKPQKVDAVAVNGPIFVNWPKPDVALVISGEQNGYLEPCGCAGLENQKGGLKRRFTFLKELRDKGWNVVPMDLGGMESRTGVQAGLKVDFSYRALTKMGYAAIGIGSGDLKIDLLSILINLDQTPVPLVSGNATFDNFDNPSMTKLYKVVEVGGMRIGITSVLGKKEIAGRTTVGDLKLLDPWHAIPGFREKLLQEKCDHLVLLSHATPAESKDLAARFPEFDWVATAHGAEVPPDAPAKIENTNSHLVEVGEKAEYVIVVGLYKNGDVPFRYQRVPVDHRFADAPEIQQMQAEYQHQLETLGLSGLGLKPAPHPSGRKFVGSNTCGSCHTQAAAVYGKTPHAHATDTLAKLQPPRHFDPECLSCHVTGWEPQKFFPYETGYLGLKETPDMVGNGCENCHGPGNRHADAENGVIAVSNLERDQLRAELRLKIIANEGNREKQEFEKGKVVQMCMECHDRDNSPEFDFQKYWPKVKHVGKN